MTRHVTTGRDSGTPRAPQTDAALQRAHGPLEPMDDPREVSPRGTIRLTLLVAAGAVAVVLACEVVAAWWGVG